MRDRLDSFYHHSHRICSSRPGEVGNSTGRVRQTRAGVYLGSLLISTPGRALRPGSQAALRRLIVSPDRVNADGHAKGCPAQVAFSLTEESDCPLRVVARAGRRSSVWSVTRTAGVKLSMCGAFWLYFYCSVCNVVCMQTIRHICDLLGTLKSNLELFQTYHQFRYIFFHLVPVCISQ